MKHFPMILICTSVLRIFSTPTFGAQAVMSGQAGNVLWAIRPTYAAYAIGEPVQLCMVFENLGDEPVNILLGLHGVSEVLATITGDKIVTKDIPAKAKRREGIQFPVQVRLPVHSIRETSILLDDYLDIQDPGTYEIEFCLRDRSLRSGSTSIRIDPLSETDKQALAERYRKLYSIIESNPFSYAVGGDAEMARRVFALSRNEVALPYQKRIIENAFFLDDEALGELVGTLLYRRDSDIIRILLPHLDSRLPQDDPSRNAHARHVIINALVNAGANSWTGEEYELIKPYLLEGKESE
ncbi:MAG: hypothetical protein WBK37_03420 [Kiritimatiellia bacterium]|nr:hypothetical protein [Candidatus Hydrogenedentota bacterium]